MTKRSRLQLVQIVSNKPYKVWSIRYSSSQALILTGKVDLWFVVKYWYTCPGTRLS